MVVSAGVVVVSTGVVVVSAGVVVVSAGVVVVSAGVIVDVVADVTMALIPGQQRYRRIIVHATVFCICSVFCV